MSLYKGSCHCGGVEFEVDTIAAQLGFSGICHCQLCRKVNNASAVHLVRCPKEAFKITKGEEQLKPYDATDKWTKRFCSNCGAAVTQGPKEAPFYALFPTNFEFAGINPELPEEFKPQVHFNFENATIPDVFRPAGSLPKYSGAPPQAGGNGLLME